MPCVNLRWPANALSAGRMSSNAVDITYPVEGIAIVLPNGSRWSLDSKSGIKHWVRGKIVTIVVCISANRQGTKKEAMH